MDILTERQKMILELIMDNYITAAEPIGSRTISKRMKSKVSSATIRNIMGDLEELGFIYKPHAVAGRIPTHKAFKYYVSNLSSLTAPGKKEMKVLESLARPRYSYVEEIMEDASKTLAAISQYTSIVIEPKVNTMLFKEVEFVKLSKYTVLIVFITSSGMVHKRIVHTDEELSVDVLNEMKWYMNEKFGGVPFYVLRDGILGDVRREKEVFNSLCAKIRDTLDAIIDEKGRREVYIEGTSMMIGVPEFSDLERLKELFQALEKKEKLIKLLDSCLREDGISIIIGHENDMKEMRGMSIISSPYQIGEDSYGFLGVIGPIRMNYSRIIPIVNYTAKTVTDILRTM